MPQKDPEGAQQSDLQQLGHLGKHMQVQPELVTAVARLPVPPLPQAASVLGHHQHDAVCANAKVMHPADALNVAEALHDGNLPERSHL